MQIIFNCLQIITSSNINFINNNPFIKIRKNIIHIPIAIYKSFKNYSINHENIPITYENILQLWIQNENEIKQFFNIKEMNLNKDFKIIPLYYKENLLYISIWFMDCKIIINKIINLESRINLISSINQSSLYNEKYFNLINGILNFRDKETQHTNQFDKKKFYLDSEINIELKNIFKNIKNYFPKLEIIFI